MRSEMADPQRVAKRGLEARKTLTPPLEALARSPALEAGARAGTRRPAIAPPLARRARTRPARSAEPRASKRGTGRSRSHYLHRGAVLRERGPPETGWRSGGSQPGSSRPSAFADSWLGL